MTFRGKAEQEVNRARLRNQLVSGNRALARSSSIAKYSDVFKNTSFRLLPCLIPVPVNNFTSFPNSPTKRKSDRRL
jgi:hypothetical protein